MDDLGEVVEVDDEGGIVSHSGKRTDDHECLIKPISASEEPRERHGSSIPSGSSVSSFDSKSHTNSIKLPGSKSTTISLLFVKLKATRKPTQH